MAFGPGARVADAGLDDHGERPLEVAALDLDHGNARDALDWLEENDPPTALHMAAKLSAFWSIRGHFGEGRRRLRSLLDLVPDSTPDRVAASKGLPGRLSTKGIRLTTSSLKASRSPTPWGTASARQPGCCLGGGRCCPPVT